MFLSIFKGLPAHQFIDRIEKNIPLPTVMQFIGIQLPLLDQPGHALSARFEVTRNPCRVLCRPKK